MSVLSGYVEHIVYRNEDNGYTVLELVDKGKEHTVVGCFPQVSEGEYLEVTGTEKKHPLYGTQLVMESYEWKIPADAAAVERYLASGAVKGIGSSLAARIVKKFGDDTFRIKVPAAVGETVADEFYCTAARERLMTYDKDGVRFEL